MIDAHCHLQFEAFDDMGPHDFFASPDPLCGDFPVTGAIVADYSSERRARLLELDANRSIWICAGIHPWALSTRPEDNHAEWEALCAFVEEHRDRLVAIGECGVDRAMRQGAPWETQWEYFRKHLDLAKEVDLPVVLHIVGGEDAVLELLSQPTYRGIRAMCHGFTGTPEQAKRFLQLGSLISIGTDIVRGRGRTREVCKQLGLAALAIETDSPSRCPGALLPPMRPAYLPYVVRSLAETLRSEEAEVIEITERNIRRFFQLDALP